MTLPDWPCGQLFDPSKFKDVASNVPGQPATIASPRPTHGGTTWAKREWPFQPLRCDLPSGRPESHRRSRDQSVNARRPSWG